MEPSTLYAICTNPRSGSWLLSEGLEATQVAGRPREWFHDSTEEQTCTEAGVPSPTRATYAPYVQHIKTVATTDNGVFGLKLHYYQFEALEPKLRTIPLCRDAASHQLLSAVFPGLRYVWLRRQDKARQAVSYHRACQTDYWSLKAGKQPPRRSDAMSQPVFDAQRIEQLEQLLISNERHWDRYFKDVGVEPLEVIYEELSADNGGVIRYILEWLGIREAQRVAVPSPALRKQSDALSEEWVERYLQYKGGRSAPVGGTALSAVPTEIPLSWKRWIGENKLLKTTDAAIVDTLRKHGFATEAAATEVARASEDPYLQAGEWVVQRLKKLESLLAAYRQLEGLRRPQAVVERRTGVTRDEFLERYYVTNRPVVLQGLMSDWRALRLWSPEYLKRIIGQEEVEIMIGRSQDANYEVNSNQHRRKIHFHEYVDMVHCGRMTNDYYLVANNAFFKRSAARHLLADIESFPAYLDPSRVDNQTFFWYGPAGTVTPLHHDTSNIFMAQVWGRKRVKLISPNDSPCLYNDIGVFSPVDCDAPDLNRYPLYGRVNVMEVTLSPGEVLFLPIGWWHHVRALDVSLTISFTNFLWPNHYEWSMPQIRK